MKLVTSTWPFGQNTFHQMIINEFLKLRKLRLVVMLFYLIVDPNVVQTNF